MGAAFTPDDERVVSAGSRRHPAGRAMRGLRSAPRGPAPRSERAPSATSARASRRGCSLTPTDRHGHFGEHRVVAGCTIRRSRACSSVLGRRFLAASGPIRNAPRAPRPNQVDSRAERSPFTQMKLRPPTCPAPRGCGGDDDVAFGMSTRPLTRDPGRADVPFARRGIRSARRRQALCTGRSSSTSGPASSRDPAVLHGKPRSRATLRRSRVRSSGPLGWISSGLGTLRSASRR